MDNYFGNDNFPPPDNLFGQAGTIINVEGEPLDLSSLTVGTGNSTNQFGVVLNLNSSALDITVNGTVGAENVYNTLQFGSRWVMCVGADPNNLYFGNVDGSGADPDMMFTISKEGGVRVARRGTYNVSPAVSGYAFSVFGANTVLTNSTDVNFTPPAQANRSVCCYLMGTIADTSTLGCTSNESVFTHLNLGNRWNFASGETTGNFYLGLATSSGASFPTSNVVIKGSTTGAGLKVQGHQATQASWDVTDYTEALKVVGAATITGDFKTRKLLNSANQKDSANQAIPSFTFNACGKLATNILGNTISNNNGVGDVTNMIQVINNNLTLARTAVGVYRATISSSISTSSDYLSKGIVPYLPYCIAYKESLPIITNFRPVQNNPTLFDVLTYRENGSAVDVELLDVSVTVTLKDANPDEYLYPIHGYGLISTTGAGGNSNVEFSQNCDSIVRTDDNKYTVTFSSDSAFSACDTYSVIGGAYNLSGSIDDGYLFIYKVTGVKTIAIEVIRNKGSGAFPVAQRVGFFITAFVGGATGATSTLPPKTGANVGYYPLFTGVAFKSGSPAAKTTTGLTYGGYNSGPNTYSWTGATAAGLTSTNCIIIADSSSSSDTGGTVNFVKLSGDSITTAGERDGANPFTDTTQSSVVVLRHSTALTDSVKAFAILAKGSNQAESKTGWIGCSFAGAGTGRVDVNFTNTALANVFASNDYAGFASSGNGGGGITAIRCNVTNTSVNSMKVYLRYGGSSNVNQNTTAAIAFVIS
jgi:hypothetical protein